LVPGKKTNLVVSFVSILLIVGVMLILMLPLDNNQNNVTNEEKTLSSLKKVDDHPLFLMTFYGDYGLEQHVSRGIENIKAGINTHRIEDEHKSKISTQTDWACTCFATLNSSADVKLYGRNFDWSTSPKLLLQTSPTTGYSSLTMVDLGMLGFSTEAMVLNASPDKIRDLLKAPYWTLDGMNDQGLAVACMAVPSAENLIDPTRITLGSLTYMRLVLDFAKDIEEALTLWEQYNVDFTGGPPLHYLISDSEGNSAVVEFVDGEMKIIRNQYPWQVSTNFILFNSTQATQDTCWRFITASETLNNSKGNLTLEEAMQLLEDVSQISTQWSVVYNLNTDDIILVINRKYNQILSYNISNDISS
jgi:hypothetical protein